MDEPLDSVAAALWFAHDVVLVLWLVRDGQKETQPCGCAILVLIGTINYSISIILVPNC